MKKRNIVSLISLVLLIVFSILLCKINLLPTNYLLIIIFVMSVICGVAIGFINIKRKALNIIGAIFIVITLSISLLGSYYLYYGNKFLDNSFSNLNGFFTKKYYVITYQNNNNEDVHNINYYQETKEVNKALEKLNIENKNSYDDLNTMLNDLKEEKIEFALVDGIYDILNEFNNNLTKDEYKVIRTISLDYEVDNTKKDAKEVFNLYIGGNDFTGKLMDFNMIITVNLNTNTILLTSIPRDYYINEVGTNKKDKLSCIGTNGTLVSKQSLEKFFDINIDYYMNINTTSLVKLVDSVGGINYCSKDEYTTTHAKVLDTYDDTKGEKLYVKKGCQHLNGIETLTVARERLKLVGGDKQRQKNCQAIMIAIFNKLKSTKTLTNYNNILSSLSAFYETNMPKEIINKVSKEVLSGNNFNIKEQSVDGTDGFDYIYLSNLKDWVMYPNMKSVTIAKDNIKEVQNEK